MHNKFAVIDGHVLITGSFNWTNMGDVKNEENLLILTDEALISQYQKRFEYLYQGSHSTGHKAEYNSRRHRGNYPLSPVKFF